MTGLGELACSSWKAMSGSTARRESGLTSGSRLAPRVLGSMACVRELGSVWLSPSDRRGVGVGAWLQVVAAGLAAQAALTQGQLCSAVPEQRRESEEEGRERRENRKSTGF